VTGVQTCALPISKVTLERLFDRVGDVCVSDAEHGPPGDRQYEYTPVFLLRGLERLHLEFAPFS